MKNIFKISREERWPTLVMLVLLLTMNGLVVAHYYGLFTPIGGDYWNRFVRHFQISGFDPITYYVVSSWDARYNVYRHPLLAFFMYPPYLLNQGLMRLTGINCALFIVAAMQTVFALYAFLFMRRIMREVIALTSVESTILSFMLFSFAFVMLSAIVPDHFMLSMMLLLLALYVSGRRMLSGRPFKVWQSVVYFLLTAGTSLNNGLKVFLCGLFVNRRRFFHWRYLVPAVIVPAALLWGFCRWEYHVLVLPGEQQRHAAKAQKIKRQKAEAARKDTAAFVQHQKEKPRKPNKRVIQGKPIANGEFMRWTDITTSRTQSVVENLFGESIQLHDEYLLKDVFRRRPVIVAYSHWWQYGVEAVVVMLFLAGIWCGRRSRFLWLTMSFFGMDMLLHVVMGFGLNEIYIMSAHWIYAIPIATAFLLRATAGRWRRGLGVVLTLLTLWLLAYNITLIAHYLL